MSMIDNWVAMSDNEDTSEKDFSGKTIPNRVYAAEGFNVEELDRQEKMEKMVELVKKQIDRSTARSEKATTVENTTIANCEFRNEIRKVNLQIEQMLVAKNKSYGDAALNPVRIFSKAGTEEQLRVRIDDKLSRFARGSEYPGDNDIDDLIGYLLLLKIYNARSTNDCGGL